MLDGAAPDRLLLARALEGIEQRAWRDRWSAADDAVVEALGLELADVDGATSLVAARVDSLLMNRVIGLGVHRRAGDATLDALAAHHAGRPAHAVNLCPWAEPDDLTQRLRERGYGNWFHHVKWCRDASAIAPVASALRITPVTAADAGDFATLAAELFAEGDAASARWHRSAVGRDGWTHLVARDGDAPVACGAVFVRDGLAWIGLGGTLESHRRRGAQGALLAHRVHLAIESGARLITLETAPDWPELDPVSWRNAQRAGFQVAYDRPSWIPSPQGT